MGKSKDCFIPGISPQSDLGRQQSETDKDLMKSDNTTSCFWDRVIHANYIWGCINKVTASTLRKVFISLYSSCEIQLLSMCNYLVLLSIKQILMHRGEYNMIWCLENMMYEEGLIIGIGQSSEEKAYRTYYHCLNCLMGRHQ